MEPTNHQATSLLTAPLDGAHPIRSLIRLYVLANVFGGTIALGLGGLAPTIEAAHTAFAWCGAG